MTNVPAPALSDCPLVDDVKTAGLILRGTQRLLRTLNFESVAEMTLNNGRRADILALGADGEIWAIEIKSSLADFRADQKWPDYCGYCDRFFFAVMADFPADVLPVEHGLIVADGYDGAIVREAPRTTLAPARRKALTLALARTAAMRLTARADPGERLSFRPVTS